MKFNITRTSQSSAYSVDDKPPCADAKTEIEKRGNAFWVEYFKNFDSIDDIIAFMDKEEASQIVISKHNDGTLGLEIYDDYRE